VRHLVLALVPRDRSSGPSAVVRPLFFFRATPTLLLAFCHPPLVSPKAYCPFLGLVPSHGLQVPSPNLHCKKTKIRLQFSHTEKHQHSVHLLHCLNNALEKTRSSNADQTSHQLQLLPSTSIILVPPQARTLIPSSSTELDHLRQQHHFFQAPPTQSIVFF
jgi:hypothetical protein